MLAPVNSPLRASTQRFDAFVDGLAMHQPALRLPAAKRGEGLVEPAPLVERVEALHGRGLGEDVDVVRRSRVLAGEVTGDHAAQHDPCLRRQPPKHGVEDGPSDVVEVDVDTPRAVLLECRRHIVLRGSRCTRRIRIRRPPPGTSPGRRRSPPPERLRSWRSGPPPSRWRPRQPRPPPSPPAVADRCRPSRSRRWHRSARRSTSRQAGRSPPCR